MTIMLHGGSFSVGLPALQVCIPVWLRLLRLTNSLELFAHTVFNYCPVFTCVMHKHLSSNKHLCVLTHLPMLFAFSRGVTYLVLPMVFTFSFWNMWYSQ